MEPKPREKLLISVVTPSLNSGKFIRDCIESVLNQGGFTFEHIIIDGGSTDETLDILRDYSHLQWISEKDRGQGDALNKGFRMARGEYILWLNSDDMLLTGGLKALMDKVQRKPADVVYGNVQFIDERSQPIKTVYHIPYSHRLTRYALYIPPTSGTLFKSRLLKELPLDISFQFIMDVDWFMSNGYRLDCLNIPHLISAFRIWEKGKTSSQIQNGLITPIHIIEKKRIYGKRIDDAGNYLMPIFQVSSMIRRMLFVEYYFKKIQSFFKSIAVGLK